jgi:hypothetical protein
MMIFVKEEPETDFTQELYGKEGLRCRSGPNCKYNKDKKLFRGKEQVVSLDGKLLRRNMKGDGGRLS